MFNEVILILLIGLLVLVNSLVSSSTRKYFDKRKKGLIRRPTYKFWGIIIINLSIIACSILQYTSNKKENIIRDKLLRQQYDSSLIQMKHVFDSSQNIKDSIISRNLGYYGFQLDESNKTIQRILKDSIRTNVILTQAPILSIENISIIDETQTEYILRIVMSSFDAGSIVVDINTPTLYVNSDKNKFMKNDIYNLFKPIGVFPTNTQTYKDITIKKEDGYLYMFFWVIGKYKDTQQKNTYIVDDIFYINFDTKIFYRVSKYETGLKKQFSKTYQYDFEEKLQ